MYPPCTLYVVQCETPKTFYIGTTYRHKKKRYDEHFAGYGCKWTKRHGCRRIVASWSVDRGQASQIETKSGCSMLEFTGPIRGGDVPLVDKHSDALPDWVLPQEFGGNRLVNWG